MRPSEQRPLSVAADAPGNQRPPPPELDLGHLRRVIVELKRGVKQALFNQHRPDLFEQYVAQAHGLLTTYLEAHGVAEIRLEVSTFVAGGAILLEDDSKENNLIYPLWTAGIRVLTFKQGVKSSELLRFFMRAIDHKRTRQTEDLATWLWKQDFPHIEWVIVTDFDLEEESGDRDAEIEVEQVISYIQNHLRTETNDSINFARISMDDIHLRLQGLEQIRQTAIAGRTVDGAAQQAMKQETLNDEKDLLRRILEILLEVMRLPVSQTEAEDLAQALERLLDGLFLEGQFGLIERLLERCVQCARDANLPAENREVADMCGARLFGLVREEQRVRAVATGLNAGLVRDLEGLRRYLVRLGAVIVPLLVDVLDSVIAAPHRRLLCDALVVLGADAVSTFAERLPTSSSNLARDLLYVLDKINPPDKVVLIAPILQHENAVLRMESLATIARTKDDACFQIVRDVFVGHPVPQMRAHAARLLAEYPPGWSEPVLLSAARDKKFDDRAEGEKRAIIGALVRLESTAAQAVILEIFQAKGGLFAARASERKLLAISALAASPGIPALKLLADVAKDEKRHSREVRDAAHLASMEMRKRILGPSASGPNPGDAP